MTTIQPDTTPMSITQGTVWTQTYTLMESDGVTPIDISADSITLYISHSKNGEPILEAAGDMSLGEDGQATVSLSKAQTQTLTAPSYLYEVYWNTAGDDEDGLIAAGEVLVEQTFFWR